MAHPDEDFVAQVRAYCEKYGIPFTHFMEILEDQKVSPMMKGKGQEWGVCDVLESLLPADKWKVTKANVNPQPGQNDSDLYVTHLETDIDIDIESKSAVRGSFFSETREVRVPHFRVKCHRSRSNTSKAEANDRYVKEDFDIVMTSSVNAFVKAKVFALTDKPGAADFLRDNYRLNGLDYEVLSKDFWFADTADLAEEDGMLPRTPVVKFQGDAIWKRLTSEALQEALLRIVRRKVIMRERGIVRRAREVQAVAEAPAQKAKKSKKK